MKNARHSKILELIGQHSIDKQEELLAPPEPQGNLSFVAFAQKLDEIAQLDLVVILVGAGAKLDFLHLHLLLLASGFVGLFLFLILELAEIHQFANRWRGHRCDFDQIQPAFFGQIQGCVQGHDS